MLKAEIPAQVEEAYKLALQVRKNAHAPYSRYLVGSAVKVKSSQKIFVGCNVENCSYGATICAERNAILTAVADLGASQLEFLVLVTDNEDLASPCGMCLQVISEFADLELPIYLGNLESLKKTCRLKDFFPMAFAKEKLPAFIEN